jgi:hypothetical protein
MFNYSFPVAWSSLPEKERHWQPSQSVSHRRFLFTRLLLLFYFSHLFMSAARRITTLATHLRATTPVLSTSSPRLPAAFAAGRTSPKLGNLLSSAPAFDAANMGAAKDLVDAAIKDNKVVVFSKSYCPVSWGRSASCERRPKWVEPS